MAAQWRRRGDGGLFIESCCCRVNSVRAQHNLWCRPQRVHVWHRHTFSLRLHVTHPEASTFFPQYPCIRWASIFFFFFYLYNQDLCSSFSHQQLFSFCTHFFKVMRCLCFLLGTMSNSWTNGVWHGDVSAASRSASLLLRLPTWAMFTTWTSMDLSQVRPVRTIGIFISLTLMGSLFKK